MSIYLYIFIMTISLLFVMLAAINACLKSQDKIFDAIEKVKHIKESNTNELSWKPSKEQMKCLDLAIAEANSHKSYNLADGLEKLKEELKKL